MTLTAGALLNSLKKHLKTSQFNQFKLISAPSSKGGEVLPIDRITLLTEAPVRLILDRPKEPIDVPMTLSRAVEILEKYPPRIPIIVHDIYSRKRTVQASSVRYGESIRIL